jgi:hypothetical protein
MGSIDALPMATAMDILIIGAGAYLNSYPDAFSKLVIKGMELAHNAAVLPQASPVFPLPYHCTGNLIIGTSRCWNGMIPFKLLVLSLESCPRGPESCSTWAF